MQQSPKDFDPSKLKIKIECPEPRDIAAGINFSIQNQQPIIKQRTNMPSQLVQTTQEKFQTTIWVNTICDISYVTYDMSVQPRLNLSNQIGETQI